MAVHRPLFMRRLVGDAVRQRFDEIAALTCVEAGEGLAGAHLAALHNRSTLTGPCAGSAMSSSTTLAEAR